MKYTILPFIGAAVALVAGPASADDALPGLSGEIGVEVQDDYTYDAEDGSDGNDLYATVGVALAVQMTQGLRLEAGFTFEPVQDRVAGEDRAFEDHGLYVDTLNLVYEWDGFAVNAGKFTPAFGLAHEFVPGLYGDTFSGGYELTERLGVGAAATLGGGDTATVAITAAAFRRDTTILSESAITERGRLRLGDGGSGNTETPENVAVTFSVADVPAIPGLIVQASGLRQGEGEGDADGTWAWGLGAAWEVALAEDVVLGSLIEYVHAEDAIGVNDAQFIDRAAEKYLTLGLALGYGNWNFAVAGGWRNGVQPGQADAEDRFAQLSAGYGFENGIGIDAGWHYLDEGGVTTKTVGIVLSYAHAF